MRLPRRQFLHLAAGFAALPTLSVIARAQSYPTRPVRVIVPYSPGGPTDVCARFIAQKLSDVLGKQFYVENVAGAGGNIGTGQAARVPGRPGKRRCWPATGTIRAPAERQRLRTPRAASASPTRPSGSVRTGSRGSTRRRLHIAQLVQDKGGTLRRAS